MFLQKLKNAALYLIYLLAITIVMLEVILRFYNPFAFRVKGYDIVLPAHQRYEIEMGKSEKFEQKVVHTKNSLGFRGPKKPADWSEKLSIVTVGGSTTECYYNSDQWAWPQQLADSLTKTFPNVWLNNAGLNGHSTFGHQVLLDKYLVNLKPKVIVFLLGINDLDRQDLNNFDGSMTKDKTQSWKDWLVNHSEVASVLLNIKRYLRANAQLGLSHDFETTSLKDMKTLDLGDAEIEQAVAQQRNTFSVAFSKRVEKLVETCQKNGIEPVLITQPLLYGQGKDPLTGVDLATIQTGDKQNGRLYWQKLEIYNEVIRNIAKNKGVFVVDLAKQMPKNSLYYYDAMHFTTQGCTQVAHIVNQALTLHFKK